MTNSPTGLLGASAAQRDRPNACDGASECRQTVIDDPGAQQPSQMFLDLGKGQTTTLGTLCPPCPANAVEGGLVIFSRK